MGKPLPRSLLCGEETHGRVDPMLVHELAEAAAVNRRIANDHGKLGAIVNELPQHLAGKAGLEVEEVGREVLFIEHQPASFDAGREGSGDVAGRLDAGECHGRQSTGPARSNLDDRRVCVPTPTETAARLPGLPRH